MRTRAFLQLSFVLVGVTPPLACGSSAQLGPDDAGALTADADVTNGRDAGKEAASIGSDARDALPSHDGSTGPGGDGASALDAFARDGARGDSAGTDAAGEVTCGGKTCYVGQACVSGACAFTGCVGSRVPGDYATITDAVIALGASTTAATICLGAQTYDENVPLGTQGPLTIQGVAAGASIIQGVTVDPEGGAGSPNTTLVGVTLGGLLVTQSSNPIQFSMMASAVDGAGITVNVSGTSSLTMTLDGVDLSATSNPLANVGQPTALAVVFTGFSLFHLTLENSYLHDSANGVLFQNGSESGVAFEGPGTCLSTVVNNTFLRDGLAVSTDNVACSAPAGMTVWASYFNDLLVDNTTALSLGGGPMSDGYNALYGNTTNYAGTTAGTGTIESNPMLDTSTAPPGLLVGSPCRGAADPAYAPNHDFYGRPRGSSVDIGAVQSSP